MTGGSGDGDAIDFAPAHVRALREVDGRRTLTVLTTCPQSGAVLSAETCARCALDRGLSFDPVDARWYRLCWRDPPPLALARRPWP